MHVRPRSSPSLIIASLLMLALAACNSSPDEPEPGDDGDIASLQQEIEDLRSRLDATPTATPSPTATPTGTPESTPTSTPEPVPEPTATPLASPSCTFEDAADRVVASTVQVRAGPYIGTAFHMGNGEFITAAHVVEGFPTVVLAGNGIHAPAQVAAFDIGRDVALLHGPATLPALNWSEPGALRHGQTVGTAGYPAISGVDLGQISVTRGAYTRSLTYLGVDLIETDTTMNPGNSGGALFDECGEVLGVVSFLWVEAQGLGAAIARSSVEESIAAARAPSPSPTSGGPVATADPFEFCRLAGTAHTPQEHVGDVRYVGPTPAFSSNGTPVAWRCWDGIVLGCLPGASGQPCLVVNDSGVPSDWLIEHCARNPNDPQPPMGAIGHANVYMWDCHQGTPRITERVIPPGSIDSFGYLIGPWEPIDP